MREIEKVECLEQLGALFKEKRLRREMTQLQIAEIVGISQAHYSLIENGKRDAEFVTIIKICQVLHIDLTGFVNSYM